MIQIFAPTTAALESDSFTLTGMTKIKVDDIGVGESVILQEEDAKGTTFSNVVEGGLGVVITHLNPSVIITGLGSYRLKKSSTAAAVGAGYEAA